MTEAFEDIASRYEAQDPAACLPKDADPAVIAGYTAFQRTHAALFRDKNTSLLWLSTTCRPGGIAMSVHIVSSGVIHLNAPDPDGSPVVDYRALNNPTSFHPVATAVKKPLAVGDVADKALRVHVTRGLRVVDASIMPFLPGGEYAAAGL
jgi:choline dehydrogenase